jgi:hypothetical protein
MKNLSNENEVRKVSEKAYAYTPGLKVKYVTTVIKERKLPMPGEVLVKEGDKVSSDSIVAQALARGEPTVLNVTSKLNVEPDELTNFIIKKEGDRIEKDELLAQRKSLFGFMNYSVSSPITGTIRSISNATGQVIIESLPIPIFIRAYIPGEVIKVLPNEGAIIETSRAAFVQGIFGIGGETHGKIKVAVDSHNEELSLDCITPDHKGAVLIGGSLVTFEALKRSFDVGVSCIIAGGVRHKDVSNLIGKEIGVAITGEEEIRTTLIITEGFGKMKMSQQTFDLFKRFEGHWACVNGATQIRAGVIRPEIIIPHEESFEKASEEELVEGMVPGTPVRIIRHPYFGSIGKVFSLPVELQEIKTKSHVRVLVIELENGMKVTVPRANVEIIEA